LAVIDALPVSRYSQAQIKDLVAYTNPGIRRAVKSSSLRQPHAPGMLLEFVVNQFSLCPSVANASTAGSFFKHSPGVPDKGIARFIFELNRLPGGYRPF